MVYEICFSIQKVLWELIFYAILFGFCSNRLWPERQLIQLYLRGLMGSKSQILLLFACCCGLNDHSMNYEPSCI